MNELDTLYMPGVNTGIKGTVSR